MVQPCNRELTSPGLRTMNTSGEQKSNGGQYPLTIFPYMEGVTVTVRVLQMDSIKKKLALAWAEGPPGVSKTITLLRTGTHFHLLVPRLALPGGRKRQKTFS